MRDCGRQQHLPCSSKRQTVRGASTQSDGATEASSFSRMTVHAPRWPHKPRGSPLSVRTTRSPSVGCSNVGHGRSSIGRPTQRHMHKEMFYAHAHIRRCAARRPEHAPPPTICSPTTRTAARLFTTSAPHHQQCPRRWVDHPHTVPPDRSARARPAGSDAEKPEDRRCAQTAPAPHQTGPIENKIAQLFMPPAR